MTVKVQKSFNYYAIMLIIIIMLIKKKPSAEFLKMKMTLTDQNSTRDGLFSQNYAKKEVLHLTLVKI